jgi:hypothetical protein
MAFATLTPWQDGVDYFINEVHSNVLTCDSNYDNTCESLANCGLVPNACDYAIVDSMCRGHCANTYGATQSGEECFDGCTSAAQNACLDPGIFCTWF